MGEVAVIDALMAPLHPADIADLLEQVTEGERAAWLALWSRGIDGEVLSELDWHLREDVIRLLPDEVVAEAVRALDSDDVVDILEDLDDHQAAVILDALDDRDRTAVEQALSYPEETAGRLMQREVVNAPEHWNVGEMIDYLRAHKADLPEQFYHVILTDPRMKPTGYITLGRLLSTARKTGCGDHRGQFPRHPGDAARGRGGLCVQPVSPDLGAGGGRGRAACRRRHHR
jgi:magnesium transporter